MKPAAKPAILSNSIHAKTKHENIRVSPVVVDAARKDSEELLLSYVILTQTIKVWLLRKKWI